MVKSSDKQIRVAFCPKCKSRNIRHIFRLGNLFGVLPKMRCGNCGNEMITFPVLVTTEKILNKIEKAKKQKKNG